MTVASNLALGSHRIEYVVCIEGVGWPTNDIGNEGDGFDGDVFTTNDLNGDLASVLGCTIHHGLSLPASISESVDPRTAEYTPSGMAFSIIDIDTWFQSNFKPYQISNIQAIAVDLDYVDTTIDIDDGTSYDENDIVWIGGREAVKLGSKANVSGTKYRYTGSTRGYLGTHRGSVVRNPTENVRNKWVNGTSTHDISVFWFNRKIAVYAHVPGETDSEMFLLWYGRLRDMQTDDHGETFQFSCTSDFFLDMDRIFRPLTFTATGAEVFWDNFGDVNGLSAEELVMRVTLEGGYNLISQMTGVPSSYAGAFMYQYRTEPGGTDGAVSGWELGGTLQALDEATAGDNLLMTHVQFGDHIIELRKQDDTQSTVSKLVLLADSLSSIGSSSIMFSTVEEAAAAPSLAGAVLAQPGRSLISNWHDMKEFNRFQVGGVVSRNPIDLLLFFMTSKDREMFRADLIGGSTTTTMEFTAGTVGATNLWAGYALFCVEGNNKWEAKEIASSDADSITVDSAFTNAGTSGTEYQVRNSRWDVLPVGWGLGLDARYLDIDSFLDVKHEWFPDEEVDRFVVGTEEGFDIWEFLQEHILTPYGLLMYFSRTTNKITLKHMQMPGSGIATETITEDDIIEPGPLRFHFNNPIAAINVEHRLLFDAVTKEFLFGYEQGTAALNFQQTRQPTMVEGGDTDVIRIQPEEVESAFREGNRDELSFGALLHTTDTIAGVATRLLGLLELYNISPPVWSVRVGIDWITKVSLGDFVNVQWNTPTGDVAPFNPWTSSKGWTNVFGRILGMNIELSDEPLLELTMELFNEVASATTETLTLVAPACTVTSKGNDAGGDYFVVSASDFIIDKVDDKDYYGFTVDDRVELRDSSGAQKEVEVVKGFGSNLSTTPEGASDDRIYVDGTIASAIAAGDYLTFEPASGSATTNMDKFSAFADSSGAISGRTSINRYG